MHENRHTNVDTLVRMNHDRLLGAAARLKTQHRDEEAAAIRRGQGNRNRVSAPSTAGFQLTL